MNLRETYNRIAEEWHKDHQQEDWWVEGTDKFISFLKPGDSVLDVGCGGGTKYAYLVKKGLRVVGIDFSEKMIEIAKREVPEGTFLVLDLGDVDKLDYLFDGIFMQAALLHVPKKEVIGKLEKLTKKLKVGGYLYVGVKERKPEGVEEEIKTEDDYGYPYERFFSYFTTDEVESYLRKAGLEVVSSEIKPSGNTNWIQVIGRK
ncbi:MAG: hypothetical protein A3B24_00315 [Candidatus Wildermuthbacteria bacterium RIFCSPLOWO2_01_FULL_48_16]|uniref:Methyltransferase domain-containing protein n=1 Tax=Candidatus Wildermuthbacteria bacterium RIFCSPLOWO2_01_FULL_48_16 TaxID=1802461 RepID=A0A1G2RMM2_9BACT|nr:MAG: hypothetical protein A3J57_01445 [Candidatus Wildermuthbacteria bacterium RIFCSPHIGHO2_02_FULL_49_12b]OHA73619.1 MAG: hypothetical protein A3B24_00315 [Candidatus Wildermuthbacteria bacterium RIFCSPLOWO2_01_FULL_48_16]